MCCRRPICLLIPLVLGWFALAANAESPLNLRLRSRTPVAGKEDVYAITTRPAVWESKQTAIIVCDMWDHHHCPTAERRVGELAPRMNAVLDAARKRGVLIIHA